MLFCVLAGADTLYCRNPLVAWSWLHLLSGLTWWLGSVEQVDTYQGRACTATGTRAKWQGQLELPGKILFYRARMMPVPDGQPGR